MNIRQAISSFERFDLERYLIEHGANRETLTEWTLDCPTCGKESKLCVSVLKKAWHCWVCEAIEGVKGRGGLLDLLQLLDGLTRAQARARILEGFRDTANLEAIEALDFFQRLEAKSEPVAIAPPPHWRPIDTPGILPYLDRRGIDFADVRAFGLFWCVAGRYMDRVIFPVWEKGVLVYWQARAMWEAGDHEGPPGKYIKALNPPKQEGAAGAGDVLMNLEQAATFGRVVITEGPIDAIHVGRDAVCSFGKKLSNTQIAKLLSAGVTSLDLMWDGPGSTEPKGAWPEMFQTAKRLRGLFDVRLVFLPRGDPGDYTRAELAQFREQCSRSAEDFSRLREV